MDTTPAPRFVVESLGCNDTRDKNGVKIKGVNEDKWRKPNKVVRVLPMERKKSGYKNKYEILSEDDEYDEENETLSDSTEEEKISYGNNDNNESERSEQRPLGLTREIMLHKMREKERILEEKEEMIYFINIEIDELKYEATKAKEVDLK